MPSVGLELVVVAGRSETGRVEFTAQTEATRALLGSSSECDWRIVSPKVEPQHAEIAWDGAQLWVRDAGSSRGVFVGRERVGDWRALGPGERVALGDAALEVRALGGATGASDDDEGGTLVSREEPELAGLRAKASAKTAAAPSAKGSGAGALPMSGASKSASANSAAKLPLSKPGTGATAKPLPTAAPRIASPEKNDRVAQRRFDEDDEGGTLVSPQSPLTGAKSAAPAENPRPSAPSPSRARSSIAPEAPPWSAQTGVMASAPPPAALAQHRPAARSQRPPPATSRGEHGSSVANLAPSATAESTMIVQNPYANVGEDTAERLAPPPGPPRASAPANALPPPRVTTKLTAAQAPQLAQIAPANAPGEAPALGSAYPAHAAHAPHDNSHAHGGMHAAHHPMHPVHAPGGAPGLNEFGVPSLAPVSANDTGGLTSLFGDVPPPPPPSARPETKLPLPARTLALLAVTLAAGVGFLFLGDGPRERAAPPAGPTRVSAAPPPRPSVQYTPPLPGPPAGLTGIRVMAATTYTPPPPPDPRVRQPPPPRVAPPPPPPRPERIAADTLFAGRLRESIPLFTFVAQQHPESPVYGQLVVLLRRKLEAQQNPCVPGGTAPCASAQPSGAGGGLR